MAPSGAVTLLVLPAVWLLGYSGLQEERGRRQEKGISLGVFLLCFLLPQVCSFETKRTENVICIPAVNTDPSL